MLRYFRHTLFWDSKLFCKIYLSTVKDKTIPKGKPFQMYKSGNISLGENVISSSFKFFIDIVERLTVSLLIEINRNIYLFLFV